MKHHLPPATSTLPLCVHTHYCSEAGVSVTIFIPSSILSQPRPNMDAGSLLERLPTALMSLVYASLPAHFKLHTCTRLNHALSSCLTPSCFQFDHLQLSPSLLRSMMLSHRLATLLSSVSSLSVEVEGAADKTLLSVLNRPPQSSAMSHPLSPAFGTALFPQLTFYSQRVDGIGFQPSSLSSFSQLQQLYVDTRRYDAAIVHQLSSSFNRLHSMKLHALLSAVHLEAIYSLPALTSLDLAGCTVLGGDIALHDMPLISLLEPAAAEAGITRLRALLCPLGEQRVADIIALVRAQKETAVLEYLRCDDSPLSDQCMVDLLALPSLTALEIHSHNIRWEQPPFAALASSSSPPPSPSLQRLRFVADHDLRDPPQLPLVVIGCMSSFLARFRHLHVLDITLPSAISLTDVLSPLLQLSELRRLCIARNRSGAGQRGETDDPAEIAGFLQRSEPAFPFLHSLTCRRIMHMDESVLIVLLAHMPQLHVLLVSESPWVGAGAVLAASAFCPQLRSIALLACSKFMLEDEHWRRSERQLQRITSTVDSHRLGRPSAPSLPNLCFLSVQVFSGSIGTSALHRLLGLLVDCPLHYFGLIIRTVAGAVSIAGSPVLPLSLIVMLEALPLVGLATPTPPLLRSPSAQPTSLDLEYSQQWVEGEEAKARRDRSVMTAERVSDEVDSDEQLLYEWMARHRNVQHEQYAHVFKRDVYRAGVSKSGRQAYFDDVREMLESQRRSLMASETAERGEELSWQTRRSTERAEYASEEGGCCCLCWHLLSACLYGCVACCDSWFDDD